VWPVLSAGTDLLSAAALKGEADATIIRTRTSAMNLTDFFVVFIVYLPLNCIILFYKNSFQKCKPFYHNRNDLSIN
jgi:hypothetical protein